MPPLVLLDYTHFTAIFLPPDCHHFATEVQVLAGYR